MKLSSLSTKQHKLLIALLGAVIFIVFFAMQKTTSPVVLNDQNTHVADATGVGAFHINEEKPLTQKQLTWSTPEANSVPAQNTIREAKASWTMSNLSRVTPTIPLSERIVVYEPVEINSHPDSFPQIGEQARLPMLEGAEIIADVQSVTTNPNGDRTWSGHLQGHGEDYPIVMTYGEHAVFATITTPQGSYSLESVDGVGWLYKNPAEVEMSTPGGSDYIDVSLNSPTKP